MTSDGRKEARKGGPTQKARRTDDRHALLLARARLPPPPPRQQVRRCRQQLPGAELRHCPRERGRRRLGHRPGLAPIAVAGGPSSPLLRGRGRGQEALEAAAEARANGHVRTGRPLAFPLRLLRLLLLRLLALLLHRHRRCRVWLGPHLLALHQQPLQHGGSQPQMQLQPQAGALIFRFHPLRQAPRGRGRRRHAGHPEPQPAGCPRARPRQAGQGHDHPAEVRGPRGWGGGLGDRGERLGE